MAVMEDSCIIKCKLVMIVDSYFTLPNLIDSISFCQIVRYPPIARCNLQQIGFTLTLLRGLGLFIPNTRSSVLIRTSVSITLTTDQHPTTIP